MIVSGGTGGHVFPALAVANELRERGIEVTWLGTQRGMENRIVPEAGIELDQISALGFRGKGLLAKLNAIKGFAIGCMQALTILHHRKPQLVLGMGGFVTAPAGIVARLLNIPLVIHEQNRVIGTANKLLMPIARQIMEAFPGTFPDKASAIHTGNPLRNDISHLASTQTNKPQSHRLHLLVLGGSQGARNLNQFVPKALADTQYAQLDVIHQCGEQWLEETSQQYIKLGVNAQVKAFIDDMAQSYQWADLVICRAGAMTVSELAAVGLPSILVPYPHAIDDHQTSNARFLVDADAALMIEDSQLQHRLAEQLSRLCNQRERLHAMSAAARALARIDATQRVADICLREARA